MKTGVVAFLAALLPALAAAGDPTRPPEGWGLPEAPGKVDAAGSLRLQSVIVPQQGGRPVAVISGKTVVLGGRLGDLTLVSLNEREAVLRGPEGLLQLFLTPDVEKQTISPQPRKAASSGKVKEAR